MPWANPALPSIQIAALKAYIDSVFGREVTTETYSAFAAILLEPAKNGYVNYYEKYQEFEEYPYFVMYCQDLLRHTPKLQKISLSKLMQRISKADPDESLSLRTITHLKRRTQRYIAENIVPQLSSRVLNVVGFTLNYYQLQASVYCAKYLREKFPRYNYLFVFGGATVSYPKVADALRNLEIEGLCVIGEGERKLELVLREILTLPESARSNLLDRLSSLHDGIYDIQRRTLNLYEANPASLLQLQIPFERLPLPDFYEYYSTLHSTLPKKDHQNSCRGETWLAMEGSRGCFAKCDFCDVHMSWSGFRKSPAERVVDNAMTLLTRHQTPRIKFMDNVCDTWAERYADLLIERKVRIESFMECRVHHPEVFWTKLSLSGVELIQVGIEALSPGLLRAMNKGTRAKQNLLVQKWLKELGIESLSNLISHHPKSTITHVRETKHVLQLIPHLDRLDFSYLSLQLGTPLDKRLTPEERRQLRERQLFKLPKSIDQYFVVKGEYEPPDKWYRKGVIAAWDDLVKWEDDFFKQFGENASLTATRCGLNEITVYDDRFDESEYHYLEGPTARLYDLCHQGATLDMLSHHLELSSSDLRRMISRLMNAGLLVELEGFYISLALRARDELIRNYMECSQETESPVGGHSVQPRVRELAVLA